MCGIAGILEHKACNNEQIVRKVLLAMQHRGPDGAGTFSDGPCSLGQVRLAVIDTTDAAMQPMTKKKVTLIYNGELYNFIDEREKLEKEGIVFKSTSDAEVVLELYIRYGETVFTHLRGMYSFAIWDSKKEKLVCARDPLGIKPFLYSYKNGQFLFASELKGLLASGLVSREVDRDSLSLLLQRGSVPQPKTMLKDVRSLLPGEYLVIHKGEVPVIKRHYKLEAGKIDLSGAGWSELVYTCHQLIADSLKRQMVSDVPLGAFLSGGIDSSLLVALMTQVHNNVKTFSVGFESGLRTLSEDETNDAKEVANYLGVDHTNVLIEQKEVLKNIREIAKGLDHPTVDGVNSWFVAKAACSDLTVAISGTGGDELFAGYPWFRSMQKYDQASYLVKLKNILRGGSFTSTFEKQYHIFNKEEATRLCKGIFAEYTVLDPLPKADTLTRVSAMVLSGYTRDQLLPDIDAAAMWHGLEVRVPLLDEGLLDFALSLPPEMKIGCKDIYAKDGSYASTGVKKILIDIGETMLPRGFSKRAKRGFTLPFDGWLRGILAADMQFLLSYDTVKRREFFCPDKVKNIRVAFENQQVHWTKPWLLMMTELWAQEVLDL